MNEGHKVQDINAEFPAAAQADWELLARKALRGQDPSVLRHTSRDDVSADALYTRAQNLPSALGEFPYTRSATVAGQSRAGWEIRQCYSAASVEQNNNLILTELNRGVSALHLQLNTARPGPRGRAT